MGKLNKEDLDDIRCIVRSAIDNTDFSKKYTMNSNFRYMMECMYRKLETISTPKVELLKTIEINGIDFTLPEETAKAIKELQDEFCMEKSRQYSKGYFDGARLAQKGLEHDPTELKIKLVDFLPKNSFALDLGKDGIKVFQINEYEGVDLFKSKSKAKK